AGPRIASDSAADRTREGAWLRGSSMRIVHLLDDGQLRGDVIVGDGASRTSSVCHRTGASGVTCVVTAGAAGLCHTEAARVDKNRDAGFGAGEIVVAGVTPANNHSKLVRRRGAPVAVNDVLDNCQSSCLIIIGDRAGLYLADSNRAGAVR